MASQHEPQGGLLSTETCFTQCIAHNTPDVQEMKN